MPDIFKNGTVSAAKDNLPVVKERTKFVKQGGEIVTGVHYVPAPGHSPDHSSILFTSGHDHFLYMGDIAHHPVTSLQHPEYSPVFDYDPAQAIKSRKKILDMAATERLLVMDITSHSRRSAASHGRVRRTAGCRRSGTGHNDVSGAGSDRSYHLLQNNAL